MPGQRDGGELSGVRVLVVEDEALIAMDIQANLESAGAIVAASAQTLPAAMDFAKRLDVSAAILDVRIGRDSVAPVAETLQKRGVPFLFYTGQMLGDPLLNRWTEAPLLSKPASPRQLADAIVRLLK